MIKEILKIFSQNVRKNKVLTDIILENNKNTTDIIFIQEPLRLLIQRISSLSQTSFSHIFTNSSMILTVLMATESPWKDLLIDTSHTSKRSVLAEILGRSTGNHHGIIY